jgi:predicted Abi (CAAX) family protease
VYGVFLICALPVGFATGFLDPGATHATMAEMLRTSLVAVVHPAFTEELVFRVLLLPRDPASMRRSRLVIVTGLALVAYVASHPLNAMLFRPQALSVFGSPAYLTLAAMLGAACTAAYWISRSIWPPVAMHWLTVVAWLYFLGGQAVLC